MSYASKRKSFQPAPHGSLVKLQAKPSKIAAVAPESPRPPEMLSGIIIHGDEGFSALDAVVYEFLISYAYEVDRQMVQDRYSIPMKALVRFVGPSVSREDVSKSINRLYQLKIDFTDSKEESRRYKGVPMIVPWMEIARDDLSVGFSFAPPIRDLMKTMPRYAYIELAALGDGSMRLKYSPALYKRLALESIRKRWQPGEENEVYIRFSPQELAEAVRFPGWDTGKLNVGKLVDFAKKSIADLEAVKRFSTTLEIFHEEGRGRPVHSFCYILKLRAPDYRHVRLRIDYSAKPEFRLGGADDRRFSVRSDLWARAERTFRKRNQSEEDVFSGYKSQDFFSLWLVALKEALDSKGLTPGYQCRSYRGDSLLSVIEDHGADYAAWGFLEEECDEPDLVEHLSNRDNQPVAVRVEAEAARRKRIGWKTTTLEKRAKLSRGTKRDTRSSDDLVAEYLDTKTDREKTQEIEEEIALAFPDFETVVPLSNVTVYRLREDLSADDLDMDVIPMFVGISGEEERLIKLQGPVTVTVTMKVSASPAEWTEIESDIAEYLAEGEAA